MIIVSSARVHARVTSMKKPIKAPPKFIETLLKNGGPCRCANCQIRAVYIAKAILKKFVVYKRKR